MLLRLQKWSDKSMEMLDVVDEEGNPTGMVVEREIAHREGIRHRTSHVWIMRWGKSGPEILLQKRSASKDSNPGCYDISSAGHILAGSGWVSSALRELKEELGIDASADELHYCGKRTMYTESMFHGRKFIDNQVSSVFYMIRDVALEDLKLHKGEVDEVRWMTLDECKAMVRENTMDHCIFMEELEMLPQSPEEALQEAEDNMGAMSGQAALYT